VGGLIAAEREREGYRLEQSLEAALPLHVWRVDLEVERDRVVSAAEATVLGLIESGVEDLAEMARVMGMRSDTRLPERVLVRLLAAGAIDTLDTGFMLTEVGRAWKAAGSARERERVTCEVRLDPVHDTLEWMDHEPSIFASRQTWTIELPSVEDEVLLARRSDVSDLIRRERLPDEEERAPTEQRPDIDLRGLSIAGRRIHWRKVRLDVWTHPLNRAVQIIGHIGEAEHPPLTKLLARHQLKPERQRVVAR